ncbi:hypothetical protein PMI03_03176 [Rhizobium sp. AP16]|nr:hypothetical protein PMI03_03176 [Rhizobium sp. AP16]
MKGLAKKPIVKSFNKLPNRHLMHGQPLFTGFKLLCSNWSYVAGKERMESVGMRGRVREKGRDEFDFFGAVAGLFLELPASG